MPVTASVTPNLFSTSGGMVALLPWSNPPFGDERARADRVKKSAVWQGFAPFEAILLDLPDCGMAKW